MNKNHKAFTLIELLVVVLIIGILAAVAVPQYQKAVEKARMIEAVTLVRKIAEANKIYFLANGTYANSGEMDKLDVDLGEKDNRITNNRRKVGNYICSPSGMGSDVDDIAICGLMYEREDGSWRTSWNIYIRKPELNKIKCTAYTTASFIQTKLCQELNEKGFL